MNTTSIHRPLAVPGLTNQRWPVVPSSLRLPPRPENRAYLRALRAAEAAAWEAQDRLSGRTTPRLEDTQHGEGGWYAVLGLIAAGAVGYGLWTTGCLAQHWDRFVTLAERLLP